MTRSILALIAVTALSACSSGSGEVKLGVNVGAAQAALVAADAVDTASESGEAALEISRVRILVAVAKIGYAGESASSADAGPYAIELTADEIAKGAHREFSLGSLPSGTYGGAEIEIDRLPSDADTSDAAFADFKTSGASVLIEGLYLGKAFEFSGHFLAEQGTDGEVTVDEKTPVTLDMSVDASTWFLDAAGAALDPTNLAQHDTLAVAICKTLDTQEAQEDLGAPSSEPLHAGGGRGGRPGGGGHARCVERAP